jgi:hypothetical protein
MVERPACADCKRLAPETETEYTLISTDHGWRLTRVRKPDGAFVFVWRCPTCWRAYKEAQGQAPSPADQASSARNVKRLTSRPPPSSGGARFFASALEKLGKKK